MNLRLATTLFVVLLAFGVKADRRSLMFKNPGGVCPFPSAQSTGGSYLSRLTVPTGAVPATNNGLFSIWVKRNVQGTDHFLLDNNTGLHISIDSANVVIVRGLTNGVDVLSLSSSATILNDGFEHHILIAWDLSVADASYIYIDGVDVTIRTTHTIDKKIIYDNTQWTISADTAGNKIFEGLEGEFYFAQAYLDITSSANRDKFYNSTTRQPVSLGTTGATPTGSQPIIYQHTPVPLWEVNSGSGGNWTEIGAFQEQTAYLCLNQGYDAGSGIFGLLNDNSTQILNDNSTEIKPDSQ